jgi:hypothetical protein
MPTSVLRYRNCGKRSQPNRTCVRRWLATKRGDFPDPGSFFIIKKKRSHALSEWLDFEPNNPIAHMLAAGRIAPTG